MRFDLASPFVCDGGVVSADRLEIGDGDDCLSCNALRAVLLDDDLDFGCSGLLRGSRSFTFLMVGRLGITDLDGLLPPDLVL